MISNFSTSVLEDVNSNFSVSLYLEQQLGPKHLPKNVVLPVSLLYGFIFITGLVGNICVCVVIAKKANMQTATNFYLVSLAVSDLLLLLFGLPNDLCLFYQQYPWVLGEAICKIRAFVSEMNNYSSVLTIVAFTVERYVAICHPLLAQTTSSLPRVAKIVAVNWSVAAASAVPFAVLTSVHYVDFPPGSGNTIAESAFCMMPTDNLYFRTLVWFSSVLFFALPMALIMALYIRIAIALRRSSLQSSECQSLQATEGKLSTRKAIVRMLVAVVIAFAICWAPFHTQRLLFLYGNPRTWPDWLRHVNEILYFAGCLYYSNATLNPILYNVMSAKYREAFREILCECCPTWHICGDRKRSGSANLPNVNEIEPSFANNRSQTHLCANSVFATDTISALSEDGDNSSSDAVLDAKVLNTEIGSHGTLLLPCKNGNKCDLRIIDEVAHKVSIVVLRKHTLDKVDIYATSESIL